MTDDLGRGQYQVEVDNSGAAEKIRATEGALASAGDAAEKSAARSTGAFSRFGDVGRGAVMGVGLAVGSLATGALLSAPTMLIDRLGDSIGLASDKAEAASKVNVLYGDSAKIIEKASKDAATAVGLSSGAYLSAAGDLGNLLVNFGITGDAAANMSTDMIGLAADMGSFNNADPSEVIQAMGAAFRGESEPIRRFGVMLDEASIKAKAVEMGLYAGTGALDKNAKAQAVYQLILAQTTKAQGDFARTSDGLANQQRIAAAKQEEAWTRLGEKIAPLAAKIVPMLADAGVALIDVISGIIDGIMEWAAENKELLDTLGEMAGFIVGVIVEGFKIFAAVIGDLATRLGGLIGVVIDVLGAIVDFGAVIVKVLSGDFEGAAASAESAMNRIGSAGENMAKAIEGSAYRSAEATIAAEDKRAAAVDKGERDMLAAVESSGAAQVEAAEQTAADMVAAAAWGGAKTPGAFADGARKSFADVRDAFRELKTLMRETLSPAKEEAELEGIATSKRLAKGLKDERPGVRYEAQQIALDTIEQLAKLNPKSEEIGRLSAKLLASASAAEAPTVRKAIATITGVAEDKLDTLPGYARKSGANTVDALAAGIRARQGEAVRAAYLLTAKVRDILLLSSPAKEGPWSERGGPQAWMEHAADLMVGGFAGRLRAGASEIATAAGMIASAGQVDMAPGLTAGPPRGDLSLTSASVRALAATGGGFGDVNVTVQIEHLDASDPAQVANLGRLLGQEVRLNLARTAASFARPATG